jgi:hypothetical protein
MKNDPASHLSTISRVGYRRNISPFILLIAAMSFWLFSASPATSQSSWLNWFRGGPQNFDDCILQGMQGVTSDIAAKAIYRSCSNKFPKSNIKSKPSLISTPINGLSVTYSAGTKEYVWFKLYHNHDKLVITSVVLEISDETNTTKTYDCLARYGTIQPRSTSEVTCHIAPISGKWNFAVRSVTGFFDNN